MKDSALIVVDMEKGFTELCPDELAVPGALEIVPVVNKLLTLPFGLKIGSRDMHPHDHCSFRENGGLYNAHCRKKTPGVEWIPGLNHQEFHATFNKGFHKNHDSHSILVDHPYLIPVLTAYKRIYLTGLVTNICVALTALDIAKAWYNSEFPYEQEIYIIEDACVSLDLPEDHIYNPIKMKRECIFQDIKYILAKDLLK